MLSDEISTLEELEELYGTPVPRSLIKEIDYISDHYKAFIENSPFVVIASVGPDGMDCSPRGDPKGFVKIPDNKTILIPDRKGNNRLDTLRNIVEDPRVSLLFLIPGVGETMRVNGTATLVTDKALCAEFIMQGKPPKSIIKVTVDRIYFQCQKALVRSGLWDNDSHVNRNELPTAGQMMQAMDKDGFDGETYDKNHPEHIKNTIY